MKKDWTFRHIGFAVMDLDRAMEYYESLGIGTIGPEIIREHDGTRLKVRYVHIGPLEIEFYQPIDGESLQFEFLRCHGEAIQHIAFNVTDIESEAEELARRGFKMLLKRELPNGNKMAYFDTGKIGDVFIELVQPFQKA